METKNNRGQCILEVAVILLLAAALLLSIKNLTGISRDFLKNSTLSKEEL